MSASVDDETILEVLRSNNAPQMTTTEVAGHLPVTRGTTRTRLQRLVDDDLIHRETEGNNVVWWLPERQEEREAWQQEETEADAAADSAEEAEDKADAEEEEDTETEADTESENEEKGDEGTGIEVTPTEQSKSPSEEGTDIEVEAVESEPDVETPDEATETRTAAERDEVTLSDDDEGLRAVAGIAVALVAVLVVRKVLSSDDE